MSHNKSKNFYSTDLKDLNKLYKNKSTTPEQFSKFNELLSNIAKKFHLFTEISERHNSVPLFITTHTPTNVLVKNWQAFMTDLQNILLPELYVCFHHKDFGYVERKKLHMMCLNLYYRSRELLPNVKVSPAYSADNYLSMTGDNTTIARDILLLAESMTLNHRTYLTGINEMMQILNSDASLRNLVTQDTLKFQQQLKELSERRFAGFNPPTKNELRQLGALDIPQNHPLIVYLLKNNRAVESTSVNQAVQNNPINNSQPNHNNFNNQTRQTTITDSMNSNSNSNSNTNSNVNRNNTRSSNGNSNNHNNSNSHNNHNRTNNSHNTHNVPTHNSYGSKRNTNVVRHNPLSKWQRNQELVHKKISNRPKLNIIFSLILLKGLSSLAMLPLIVGGFVTISTLLLPKILFEKIFKSSNKLFLSKVVLSFAERFLKNFGLLFVAVIVGVFIFAESSPWQALTITSVFLLLASTFYHVYKKDVYSETDAIDSEVIENNSESNQLAEQSGIYNTLPLDSHVHAKYLRMLLSPLGQSILEDLINTVNELDEISEYLKDDCEYLSTSVRELIRDITKNSILRLNVVAKGFVKNGKVSVIAKRQFSTVHEQQVLNLFRHNIDEIKALNQSILDKKMSAFSQTGTSAEHQFRETITELKILLRWYIAQQPDECTANSHQVILDNLERTTLKQMTDIFYQANSTDTQRQQLQMQLDDLLEHFKSQSPTNQNNNGDDLLRITHEQNFSIDSNMTTEGQQEQLVTQDFIDFNGQYVKQLKQHW